MAEQYIDHGCYVPTSGNLGATPTWGLPQEGDGSATSPSTASSVANITLTTNAVAGNSLSICGISFAAVASGAGNNQFNVGASLAATADNIASAINGNGSTTTVSSNVAIGTPTLRNLVYARGPTTRGDTNPVVDIMMRVGSAALNYANNSYVGITSSGWSAAPTVSQFTGGVGGCYGWFVNDVTLGGGVTYTVGLYGYGSKAAPFVMVHSDNPTAQRYTADMEYAWLRSGNGYSITMNGDFLMTHALFPQNVMLDTNTRWTGDSGNGTFTMRMTCGGNNRVFSIVINKVKSIGCLKKYAFRVVNYSTPSGGVAYLAINTYQSVNNGSFARYHNLYFGEEDYIAGNASPPYLTIGVGGYGGATFQNCKFSQSNARSGFGGGNFFGGTLNGMMIFEDCEFEFNHNSVTDPGPIANITYGSARNSILKFGNCSFTNLSPSSWSTGKYQPHAPKTSINFAEILFDNCTGLRIDNYIGFSNSQSFTNPNMPSYFYRSGDAYGAFRHETWQGVVEWNPDASPSQPLLNSILPDGTTRYSLKVDWLYISNVVNESQPWRPARLAQFIRGSTAKKTVSLEMFVKSALTMNTVTCGLRVQYTDSTGVARSELLRYNDSGFTNSTAQWINAGNFPSYVAKNMSLTTQYMVKSDTEIVVYLEMYNTPTSNQNEQFYIDPQFTLTDA